MIIKTSIIIPYYNSEEYIKDAIQSIKKQSDLHWECILINDGSTDNSEQVVLDDILDDPRFRNITITHGGPGKARNVGVENSIGQYIVFLDSDDLLSPDYVRNGSEYLDENKDCTFYYADFKYFGVGCGINHVRWVDYKYLLQQPTFRATSMIHRKRVLEIGGFNEDLKTWEDWDFWIRYLYKYDNVKIENNAQWKYRSRFDSRHHSTPSKELHEVRKQIKELNKEIYKEFGLYESDSI